MCKEMRTCSIKWFGKIPSEWKIVKVKQLFNIGRGRVIAQTELDDNGAYPVYSSQTKNNGCLGYINTYDFDKKQLTWTTDGANAGTVFLREGKYNCTNVCGTLLPKNEENNLDYLKYILEYTAIFHKRADTNGFKIMNNEMAEISILLPNKVEQDKIADYLNKKVSKIDDIILKQKKLIEKYKDYKQSLIVETVTKGLNKNVPMKDSGIEWIGEIPIHWGIVPIKRVATLYNGKEIIKEIEKSEVSYNVYGSGGIFKYTNHFLYDGEAVLFGRKGSVGNPMYIIDKFWTIDTMYYSVCNDKLNCKMFYYILKAFPWNIYVTKTALPSIVGSEIFKCRIPICINKIEQEEIVEFLDKKCTIIDSAIIKKEQLIEKLEDYKKSLIYECVTGKREVN